MLRFAIPIIIALTGTLPVQTHAASRPVDSRQISVELTSTFSPAERNLIRAQLLAQRQRSLPRSGKRLPSGWQERVVRGKSLGYHVYRQGISLPDTLLQRLAPLPAGCEILQVGEKVVRIESATRMIFDSFDLVPTP